MRSEVLNSRNFVWMAFFLLATLFFAGAVPAHAQTNSRGLPDFSDLVDRVGPAVVNIRTTQKVSQNPQGFPGFPGMDPNDPFFEFFRRFMPPGTPMPGQPGQPGQAPRGGQQAPEREVPSGVGSGFVIDSDGYLLTNHHVVDGAESIIVTFPDKREFKGKVIGSDQRTDVALVKIEGKSLPFLKIGNVNNTKVGQWVVAIGSPFGLENSVTAGIVSAKGRDTGEYLPFIQTDVAVNPGNSGGPLLNLDGEVIGINSQIYSRTGGFMGISFAIPIDEAMRVAKQLRENGKVSRGRIGVGIGEVDKDVAKALGLDSAVGALVGSVGKDSPADKAGVIAGDIILRFDGKKVEKASDLPRIVGETKPGSKVNMVLWRKGAEKTVSITVAEFETEAAKPAAAPAEKPKPVEADKLGLTVTDPTAQEKSALNLTGGVVVRNAVGMAASAGITAGDVILRVGRTDITSAKQFADLVKAIPKGQAAPMLVRRGENSFFVVLTP
ncbi:MAG: DegQ family serine endoprotease [Gammaproteobacteria bacterium]|jgi:serine protease Do|uniref:Probable periplasmic serine endoprotease DegP-like n=2 Tax=Pseudomonadota TaxID=1224 RepID=A0ABX6N596_9BURK|nr:MULTISPECIES: DegQ family serine endoprotease [unclassified Limnobacter]MAG80331.1 serine peptidase [Sutterellaceae bacterium]MBU0542760.1 DegQ family serine endoprotease [Gammaproteobacteria bacterium]PZO14691.1 MAG: serine peptidase [Betaproteobacteria bacterium]MBT85513.1 serine peptidase [Sutterellaceae bacterium]MDP3270692.1 DegQ family serine endoprotease [Limnobacter sp.]